MIDPDWLRTLDFEAVDGWHVSGVAGIGSQNVVLKAVHVDGREVVVRMTKRTLGFHINEVPPAISARPEYDLSRVNEKLTSLVGRQNLDTMSCWLDDLYSLIMKIISEVGIGGLIFSNMSSDSVETIPFIIHTPPIARRLQEYVEWVVDEGDAAGMLPSVNGEKYPIRLLVLPGRPPKWAKDALDGLPRLPEHNKDLQADGIFKNWLVVWGIAAMEGFFTDEEMPEVARYLESKYGRAPESADVLTLIGQADAMANLFAQYLEGSPVARFVLLCAHCGIMIRAHDKEGKMVADGFHLVHSR